MDTNKSRTLDFQNHLQNTTIALDNHVFELLYILINLFIKLKRRSAQN